MEEYSADKLVGVNVYNAGNEKVGEIKGHTSGENKADKAILSVGGFLGLGEHYVAVPFDQVKRVVEDLQQPVVDRLPALRPGRSLHAAISPRAFRRITCGGCPKARRKARRMRPRSAKPVCWAMTSIE
jgi:hypothetical protein